MELFDPRSGDEHQLASLYAGEFVLGNHIGLDDDGHPCLEYDVGERTVHPTG